MAGNWHRVWTHRKTGGVYTVIGWDEEKVFYVSNSTNNTIWWRPIEEFLDGRFVQNHTYAPMTLADAGFLRG